MVDVTKPIVNPRLSEALAALHRENTPANQDRALRELMTQAHLLAPVVLTPAPVSYTHLTLPTILRV